MQFGSRVGDVRSTGDGAGGQITDGNSVGAGGAVMKHSGHPVSAGVSVGVGIALGGGAGPQEDSAISAPNATTD